MMKLIFAGLLAGGTGLAWLGSAHGAGLPGLDKKPVSIRQESQARRSHGHGFLYFGALGRRHHGGGYRGGK